MFSVHILQWNQNFKQTSHQTPLLDRWCSSTWSQRGSKTPKRCHFLCVSTEQWSHKGNTDLFHPFWYFESFELLQNWEQSPWIFHLQRSPLRALIRKQLTIFRPRGDCRGVKLLIQNFCLCKNIDKYQVYTILKEDYSEFSNTSNSFEIDKFIIIKHIQ